MDEKGVVVVDECFTNEIAARHPASTVQTAMSGHPSLTAVAAPHLEKLDDDPASSSTLPSSPPRSDPALFSDNAPVASPPSSPPPQLLLSPPPPTARKPAFSFLKRKRSAHDAATLESANEPLSDTTNNVLKIPPRPVKKPRLTQMQIDLGGEIRKTCPSCRMEYIPSNKEDAALHKEFHSMNVGGVDLGKGFSKYPGLNRIHSIKGSLRDGETIAIIDRRSSSSAKKKVRKVLEVVNAELSATDLDDEQLWGGIITDSSAAPSAAPPTQPQPWKKKRKAYKSGADKRADRFKAFLYFDGDNCVGLCLAEKITTACRVLIDHPPSQIADQQNPETTPQLTFKSSSISCAPTPDPALLGISRIWTSKSHRGRDIAVHMLECARNNFFFGVLVPKDRVAFSQPTESGGKLARRWFGAEEGWMVYREGM